ncbi:hypothetical protein [Mycolicibacterium elephantis]|uniref:Uncharacterized protein n=1 Tax=Mycolicibacterium elephantis DSM 44368 TaxID=1335622 RepID=A0A439E0M7_9MYCO|nr:hypothetical protein [Mycolicibacterium elephantis]MCV7221546.1 hypothetical protein [Mycolicibacterium elephantis]RWA23984.1 hypothetical protein MELE44368_01880 [Mycolicibacterium elephantis DSM 44368]
MADGDDNFKQEWFGRFVENIPNAYVSALRHLARHAQAKLGFVDGGLRSAFWIDGRSFYVLQCRGVHDLDAQITGLVIQLDNVTSAGVAFEIDFNPSDNSAETGRILTIRSPDGPITITASPGAVPDREERAKIEVFIDQVLDALAGRDA